MLFLKWLLIVAGIGLLGSAAALVLYDVVQAMQYARLLRRREEGTEPAPAVPQPIRWRLAAKVAAAAWLPLLAGISIFVVPDGMAGVRVSQFSGVRPGTVYSGVHLVKPLVERIVLFDIRERMFTTAVTPDDRSGAKKDEMRGARPQTLGAQSREGLTIGLAVAVRYRLDPQRLDYIQANLPQPVSEEIVEPVVASAFREVVPNFLVREVFATKREEVRQRAADRITRKLAADGVIVKEVMLRDIRLPAEYAKGLEQLLLKEQENERLVFEIEIKQKHVRTAELEAEAAKAREVKQAEAAAQVRVLQAKAEADAMQHTLPLKEKQVQQSRLEAEARKEATLKNAEAAAEAKIIDSKAELERRKYLAEADANRIRVTAAADAERMKLEALVLKQNPLLIQKIIAERLSDKVQIMMVPMDGKFFFTNDVLRSSMGLGATKLDDADAPAPPRP